MKKIFACTLLITAPAFPAALPLAPALFVPFAPAVIAVDPRGAMTSENHTDLGVCMVDKDGYPYTLSDDKDAMQKHYQSIKDRQKLWQGNQRIVADVCSYQVETFKRLNEMKDVIADHAGVSPEEVMEASDEMSFFSSRRQILFNHPDNFDQKIKDFDQAVDVLCPKNQESFEVYIARVQDFYARVDNSHLSTKDLFEDVFWDAPWEIKRYLLAMNIETGLLHPDETLEVSRLTPLDHAAQQNDPRLASFLWWNYGARKTNNPHTMRYIKGEMMKSEKPESVQALEEIVNSEGGSSLDWLTVEWATDLDPEFVERKLRVLVKMVYHVIRRRRSMLFPAILREL
jgi:hypothetical protein